MQKITNQSHSKETYLYVLSRAFERASYYGIRGIILIYMLEALYLPQQEAFKIYDFFITALIFSQVLGALLGDFAIGNKKVMIIGGVLQAFGIFMLCIPSATGLYVGLSLILLGSGLYSPNILAQFGKLYLNKQMLMDAGFSLFYFAVNLGAFIGIFVITSLGEGNYSLGFLIGGLLMLLSVAISFFIKEKEKTTETTETINYKSNFDKRLLIIVASILIVAVYWSVYDYSSTAFSYLDSLFAKNATIPYPPAIFTTFSTSFIVPIGITVSIIWSFWYNSHLTKITIGFISGAIALGLLSLLPANLDSSYTSIAILSIFLLNLAEFHLGPILYSILTKNSNPKYLATIISLSFIPSKIFMYIIGLQFRNSEEGLLPIYAGAIILSIISVVLVILLIAKNKKNNNVPMTSKHQSIDVKSEF